MVGGTSDNGAARNMPNSTMQNRQFLAVQPGILRNSLQILEVAQAARAVRVSLL